MSKRGYVSLISQSEKPRRGLSIRNILWGKGFAWVEEEAEGQENGSIGPSMLVDRPGSQKSNGNQTKANDHSSFGNEEESTLPSFDDERFAVTEALQFEPSSPTSSKLEVFIAKTSPPGKRKNTNAASESVCVKDIWEWPWPDFSFVSKDGGWEHHGTEPDNDRGSPNRRVRFADEEGKPIHRIRERPIEDEEPEWVSVLILLLSPENKKFELIQVSYHVGDDLRVSDVLDRAPQLATTPILAEQTYTGFCRPFHRGVELINSMPIRDCGLANDEAIVANLYGMTSKQTTRLAYPLLMNAGVLKTVKRHTRHGYRVHKLTSDTFAGRCPMITSKVLDDIAEGPSSFEKLPPMDHATEASKGFRKTILEGKKDRVSPAPPRDAAPRGQVPSGVDHATSASIQQRDLHLASLDLSEMKEGVDAAPKQRDPRARNRTVAFLGAGLLVGLSTTLLRRPARRKGSF